MTFLIKKFFFTMALIVFAIGFHFSGIAQDKKLTFSQVYMYAQPRLLQRLPVLEGWLDDDHYIQVKNEDGKSYLMKVDASSGKEKIIANFSNIGKILCEGFDASEYEDVTSDFKNFLFSKDDDLYYYSLEENDMKRLTEDEDIENNPSLSPNGKKTAFTKNHNLFVVDNETGTVTQLTFDGTDVIYNGWLSWVYMEEILGRATGHKAYWWAPNNEMIAFLHTDDSPVPVFPLVSYDNLHCKVEWERYPKSGDPNPDVKLGIVHLNDGRIVWVKEDETIDQYTAWPSWTKDNQQLFYQVLNRGQDTLQILSANPITGDNKLIYTETQPTWVEFFEDIYIFKNGSGFLLRSDIDGWRHLYYYDMNGKLIKRLTSSDWDVREIKLVNEKDGIVYFEGFINNSTENHLYSVELDGSNLKQISVETGWHSVTLSPEGSYYYDTFSNIYMPEVLDLFDDDGDLVREIGNGKTTFYDQYKLGTTELFNVTTADGIELPAKWVLPPNFNPKKKYPVIFSIYGGPGTQDVKNDFYPYLNSYFIASKDIIYFVVDHRGSAHFGKKGVAKMYLNLGKWEMNDYIEAVKWLKQIPFVDSTRIGIMGGSYGGYIAAMALTYGSDYFTHGIDGSGVTDWRLYDDVYTERYMDKPEEDPEGYEFGSVMTHADKYKGHLLITHGMLDDNVHEQNAFQLVNLFTDLDKDFELMLYPNSRHGVRFPKFIHEQRNSWNFWFRQFFGKEFEMD